MGILRKMAKVILSLLFSLSLMFLILTFFLRNLTSYENTKNIFTTIFTNFVFKNMSVEEVESVYEKITFLCAANPNFTFPVDSLNVSCSEISGKDLSSVINFIATKFLDSIYFKSYECSFVDCLKNIKSLEDFLIIFSAEAHEFFDKTFRTLLITTIALGMVLLISIETWLERFKTFGLEFMSIGTFFFIFYFFRNFIPKKLPIPLEESILDLIFNKISTILLFLFVVGASLVFLWIFLKILSKKAK